MQGARPDRRALPRSARRPKPARRGIRSPPVRGRFFRPHDCIIRVRGSVGRARSRIPCRAASMRSPAIIRGTKLARAPAGARPAAAGGAADLDGREQDVAHDNPWRTCQRCHRGRRRVQDRRASPQSVAKNQYKLLVRHPVWPPASVMPHARPQADPREVVDLDRTHDVPAVARDDEDRQMPHDPRDVVRQDVPPSAAETSGPLPATEVRGERRLGEPPVARGDAPYNRPARSARTPALRQHPLPPASPSYVQSPAALLRRA